MYATDLLNPLSFTSHMNGENFFTKKRTFTEWFILVFIGLLIFSSIWIIVTYDTGTPLWIMGIAITCLAFFNILLIMKIREDRRKRKELQRQ